MSDTEMDSSAGEEAEGSKRATRSKNIPSRLKDSLLDDGESDPSS